MPARHSDAARNLWSRSVLTNHVSTAVLPSALGPEFTLRFANFAAQKFKFELLSNPVAVDMERAPMNLQNEMIDLQCIDTLNAKYDSAGTAHFPSVIPITVLLTQPTCYSNADCFKAYTCVSSFSL